MFSGRKDMHHLHPDPKTIGLDFTYDDFNGMPYRKLGHSGLRISNIGLGTWKFGYPEMGDGARVDKRTGMQILDMALDEGVTFWDTANRYNNSSGNSERLIGKWLKANSELRNYVVIATKLFGATDGPTPNHCRLSRANILESVYASLERLQTDYIDLLYFHSFEDETPVEESLMAIEDLIAQDLVRYFGVSNFTVENLKLYARYQEKFMRSKVQAVQNRYDLLYREESGYEGVLEYCVKNELSFIPWGPLRQGLLTERYLDKSKVGKGDRLFDEEVLDEELTPAVKDKLDKLASIAHKHDMTLTTQTLAYMLTLPGMGSMIVSSSTPEQLKENAKAGKIKLSKEQKAEIEQII